MRLRNYLKGLQLIRSVGKYYKLMKIMYISASSDPYTSLKRLPRLPSPPLYHTPWDYYGKRQKSVHVSQGRRHIELAFAGLFHSVVLTDVWVKSNLSEVHGRLTGTDQQRKATTVVSRQFDAESVNTHRQSSVLIADGGPHTLLLCHTHSAIYKRFSIFLKLSKLLLRCIC